MKSDRKRSKEGVGGCVVASVRNHVKENTFFSHMVSKTPITNIEVLSIRYMHLYIYIYIYSCWPSP